MLRVLGGYMFGKNSPELKGGMESVFKLENNPWFGYIQFNRPHFYLIYEHVKSDEAKKYYYIDEEKDTACFVIGNIHAFEEGSLELLSSINLAHWFVQKYEQKRSFAFVKHIRGIFNIVLFYKGVLFLVNDILGLSPMYISEEKRGIIFCNDAEAILGIRKTNVIDKKSVVDFFVYGYVPDGKTFVKDVCNQARASVLRICGKRKEESSYGSFQPMDLTGLDHREKIEITHDTFQEALAIRTPGREVVADLTGGWDSRFIIANLLKLNKKITVVTTNENALDLATARLIARKFKLKHVIEKRIILKNNDMKSFIADFSVASSKHRFKRLKAMLKESDGLMVSKYLSSRKVSGLFGNGCLGHDHPELVQAYQLNYGEAAKRIFSPDFLGSDQGSKSKPLLNELLADFSFPKQNIYRHSYLVQITRSFLSVYNGNDWAKPTRFFRHLNEMPFADSKFLSLIFSLEGPGIFDYEAYNQMYERYYPEFTHIPWTFDHLRRDAPKNINSSATEALKSSFLYKSLSEDPKLMSYNQLSKDQDFLRFIKNKKIFSMSLLDTCKNIKKLYFFYCWYRANESLLSDGRQFIG